MQDLMGERADLMGLVASSWKPNGHRISPAELMEWTPHHIYGVFYQGQSKFTPGTDNLTLLTKHNQTRAANNQRPVAPSWFLPKLRKK